MGDAWQAAFTFSTLHACCMLLEVTAVFYRSLPLCVYVKVTSHGLPKVIDVIDCTGSGDIDTSATCAADADGLIEGASGRKLKPNPSWQNPTGKAPGADSLCQ